MKVKIKNKEIEYNKLLKNNNFRNNQQYILSIENKRNYYNFSREIIIPIKGKHNRDEFKSYSKNIENGERLKKRIITGGWSYIDEYKKERKEFIKGIFFTGLFFITGMFLAYSNGELNIEVIKHVIIYITLGIPFILFLLYFLKTNKYNNYIYFSQTIDKEKIIIYKYK